jgi:SAM-dependent methyltransferase
MPISERPLYTSFAWAYDLVVRSPPPPQPDEVARLLAGRRTIVDIGCGTGRHAAYLAAASFAVTGVDASPQMIEVARSRMPDVRFEVGDVVTWRPPSPADGVLCRGVFNEITDDEDRQRGFDALFAMLRPGGLLIFSVRELEMTRARYAREPVGTRSEAGVFFRSEAHLVGDLVLVEETISSEDARSDYRFEMRPWSLSELDQRAATAGFTRVERRIEGDRIVAACLR